jgi:hypothetical protein
MTISGGATAPLTPISPAGAGNGEFVRLPENWKYKNQDGVMMIAMG